MEKLLFLFVSFFGKIFSANSSMSAYDSTTIWLKTMSFSCQSSWLWTKNDGPFRWALSGGGRSVGGHWFGWGLTTLRRSAEKRGGSQRWPSQEVWWKKLHFPIETYPPDVFFWGIFQLKPVKPDFWAVEKTISTRQKHMWLEQLQDIVRWTSLVFSGHGTAPGGGQFLLRHLGCEARVGAPQ